MITHDDDTDECDRCGGWIHDDGYCHDCETPEPVKPHLDRAKRMAQSFGETPHLRVELVRQLMCREQAALDRLAEVRAFVDRTWTQEDTEALHSLLQPGSIRSQFLRILDREL